jgi:hypothetical protein
MIFQKNGLRGGVPFSIFHRVKQLAFVLRAGLALSGFAIASSRAEAVVVDNLSVLKNAILGEAWPAGH